MTNNRHATSLVIELRDIKHRIHTNTDDAEYTKLFIQFLTKFTELDELLSHNGGLPIQWITKLNQLQLSIDHTNAPHDFTE